MNKNLSNTKIKGNVRIRIMFIDEILLTDG